MVHRSGLFFGADSLEIGDERRFLPSRRALASGSMRGAVLSEVLLEEPLRAMTGEV